MEIFDYNSFLSQDEIEKIESQVFSLREYWKNMLEYPCRAEKKDFFQSYLMKQIVQQIKYEILSNENIITKETCEKVWDFLCKNYNNIDLETTISFDGFKDLLDIIKQSNTVDEKLLSTLFLKVSQKDKCQNMLGDAIYLFTKNQREDINWSTQKIIKEEFKWLHEKTISTISKIFECPVELDDSLPCPAFHIFGLESYKQCEYQYHQDTSILRYYPKLDSKKIYSFISLIKSTTKESAHLDYVSVFDTFQKHYRYGDLHFWPGLLKHRIGSFSLEQGECRITYQGHMYFDEQNKIYKLYF